MKSIFKEVSAKELTTRQNMVDSENRLTVNAAIANIELILSSEELPE